MRCSDLIQMSLSNLLKRKARTVLTVLGVVIGVASIVVMVSLGLGLKKSMMENIENSFSLTQITVNQPWNNNVGEKPKYLDDALIKEIRNFPYVESIDPYLNIGIMARYGNYESYLNLQGTTLSALQNMKIDIGEGTLPKEDAGELQLFFGNRVIADFQDAKTGKGYWDTNELPNIDFMKDPVFYILDQDAYYQSKNGGTDENGQPVKKPRKHLFKTAGVAAGGMDDYHNYSYNTYCDINELIPVLKKEFKKKAIPGQPTNAKGKPYKDIYYSQLVVNVDKMEHVKEVTKSISDMGYEAYNDAEWIESQQKQIGMIQAVLGGIGAVSLFVAAIGIANTMMMSIYERTKEIGIMKVLGCDLKNIGAMFLMEAGFIGLIGGGIGMLFSYGISALVNYLAKMSGEVDAASISYIPPWLIVLAIIFAILVGMLAGFFPARRAMKLSPLAAMRNE